METTTGSRLRELRCWRGLALREAAELSGISYGFLGKLERDELVLNNRQVLESLAATLRVAPGEIIGEHSTVTRPETDTRAAMAAVEDVLTGWAVGEAPEQRRLTWPEIDAAVVRLDTVLRPSADYAGQAELLPGLIRELLAAATEAAYRRSALVALMGAYKSVAYLAHDLGLAGLPTFAIERMRQAADELGDPTQQAEVDWRRAHILSGSNRPRQYELAARVADTTDAMPHMRGMAHLTAALAAAAQGDGDTARTHLTEADDLAHRIDTDDEPWTLTDFGRSNVAIWRVSLGVELGEGAKVAELAKRVRLGDVPPHRRAAFWMDLGHGLLTERTTRDDGLAAFLRAERIAPQKVRSNAFAREAVSNLLRTARGGETGRELRGLAWRMGIAPAG